MSREDTHDDLESLEDWLRYYSVPRYDTQVRVPPLHAVTSDERPIEVNCVDPKYLPEGYGALGMTFAPGKKQSFGFSGAHDRDLGMDLDRLRHDYDTDVLVTLLEREEMSRIGVPTLLADVQRRGMTSRWLSIQDMTADVSPRAFYSLMKSVIRDLKSGKNVVVHCKGGLGRTGMLVACVLVWLGHPAAEAVRITRESRRNTIDLGAQLDLVWTFDHYKKTKRWSPIKAPYVPSEKVSLFTSTVLTPSAK